MDRGCPLPGGDLPRAGSVPPRSGVLSLFPSPHMPADSIGALARPPGSVAVRGAAQECRLAQASPGPTLPSRPSGSVLVGGCVSAAPRRGQSLPTVAVAHDLNHVLFPATTHWAHLWACRLFFQSDLRRATAVVAVSRGTAARLRQHLGIHADMVVPPAVGRQFRAPPMATQRGTRREKYGIIFGRMFCLQ